MNYKSHLKKAVSIVVLSTVLTTGNLPSAHAASPILPVTKGNDPAATMSRLTSSQRKTFYAVIASLGWGISGAFMLFGASSFSDENLSQRAKNIRNGVSLLAGIASSFILKRFFPPTSGREDTITTANVAVTMIRATTIVGSTGLFYALTHGVLETFYAKESNVTRVDEGHGHNNGHRRLLSEKVFSLESEQDYVTKIFNKYPGFLNQFSNELNMDSQNFFTDLEIIMKQTAQMNKLEAQYNHFCPTAFSQLSPQCQKRFERYKESVDSAGLAAAKLHEIGIKSHNDMMTMTAALNTIMPPAKHYNGILYMGDSKGNPLIDKYGHIETFKTTPTYNVNDGTIIPSNSDGHEYNTPKLTIEQLMAMLPKSSAKTRPGQKTLNFAMAAEVKQTTIDIEKGHHAQGVGHHPQGVGHHPKGVGHHQQAYTPVMHH